MASELIVGGSVGASSSGTAGRVSLIDSTLGVSFPIVYMCVWWLLHSCVHEYILYKICSVTYF